MTTKTHRVWNGTALIAGTTIGGGMLALPVLTGQGGFFPSLLIYFASFAFMLSTGLLFLELSFSFPKRANFLTFTRSLLGSGSAVGVALLYFFLFYCLVFAYIVGIGDLLVCSFPALHPVFAKTIAALVAFFTVLLGAKRIGSMNSLFFLLLAGSFALFFFFGLPHFQSERLLFVDWGKAALGLPVAFTAFAYQGTVPTLVAFVDRDAQAAKKAIFFGTLIPLLICIAWQALILGILPKVGAGSLVEALERGECAVIPLQKILPEGSFLLLSRVFGFSALLTSLIGVALGLGDFIKDAFKCCTPTAAALVALPPLAMAFSTTGLFLAALDSAGGIGCAVLLGALPIILVSVLRYKKRASTPRFLPGGAFALVLLFVFFILEFYLYLK